MKIKINDYGSSVKSGSAVPLISKTIALREIHDHQKEKAECTQPSSVILETNHIFLRKGGVGDGYMQPTNRQSADAL